MKFGRGAAPCGTLRPARFRGSPVGLFRPPAPPFVCGFVASLPDTRAVPSNPESGCRADHGAAPAILGLSNGEMPSIFTNLVAFPLGFWWRAPLGLIVVRHGRGVQGAPADESTCGERAARANYGKTHVTWCCRGAPRRDGYKNLFRLDRTRRPQRTATATSTISGALPSSTCNFPARPQR